MRPVLANKTKLLFDKLMTALSKRSCSYGCFSFFTINLLHHPALPATSAVIPSIQEAAQTFYSYPSIFNLQKIRNRAGQMLIFHKKVHMQTLRPFGDYQKVFHSKSPPLRLHDKFPCYDNAFSSIDSHNPKRYLSCCLLPLE